MNMEYIQFIPSNVFRIRFNLNITRILLGSCKVGEIQGTVQIIIIKKFSELGDNDSSK